jgi:hypothetical protein
MLCVVLAVSSGVAEAQRRRPWPKLYRPAGSDHRKHIRQQERAPTHGVRAGRFFGRTLMPRGPLSRARRGDHYLRSTRALVIVGADDGQLRGFARAPGFRERLRGAALRVRDATGTHRPQLRDVSPIGATPRQGLRVRASVGNGPPLAVITTLRLRGGLLELETELHNQGTRPRLGVRLCERLETGPTPLWAAGLGWVERGWLGRRASAFVARRDGDLSWLLTRDKGPLAQATPPRRRPRDATASPFDVCYPRVDLAPRQRVRVRRLLVLLRGDLDDAAAAAGRWRKARWQRATVALPPGLPPGSELRLFGVDGRPLLAVVAKPTVSAALRSRAGAGVRGLRHPATKGLRAALWLPGIGLGPQLNLVAKLAPKAPARARARITITDPRGRALAAQLSIFSSAGQLVSSRDVSVRGAELSLAPGRYRFEARRGLFSRPAIKTLRLREKRRASSKLTLHPAIPRRGWRALDLRAYSRHGGRGVASPRQLLVAGAAAGLDALAVADLDPPTTASLRANRTTGPLLLNARERCSTRFGCVTIIARTAKAKSNPSRAARSSFASPATLFSAAKRARSLLLISHPWHPRRGYLAKSGFDARGGAASSSHYRPGFQLLELLSEDDTPARRERKLHDFLALLARGQRVVGVGASGARLSQHRLGSVRTLLQLGSQQGAEATPDTPARLLEALAAGRAVASAGPIISLTVDGKPIGATVRVEPRRRTTLQLSVHALPGVDTGAVELYQGRRRLARLPARSRGVRRLRYSRTLRATKRTFIVAVVRGRRSTSGRGAIVAVTNPIWLLPNQPRPTKAATAGRR